MRKLPCSLLCHVHAGKSENFLRVGNPDALPACQGKSCFHLPQLHERQKRVLPQQQAQTCRQSDAGVHLLYKPQICEKIRFGKRGKRKLLLRRLRKSENVHRQISVAACHCLLRKPCKGRRFSLATTEKVRKQRAFQTDVLRKRFVREGIGAKKSHSPQRF